MTSERDKLIELLDIIIQPGQKTLGDIADHLLANGVIVPPCKVGDVLHEAIFQKNPRRLSHFRECKVVGFHMGDFPELRPFNVSRDNYLIVLYYNCGHLAHIPFDKLGKTVFLSREEAEKALRKEDEGK